MPEKKPHFLPTVCASQTHRTPFELAAPFRRNVISNGTGAALLISDGMRGGRRPLTRITNELRNNYTCAMISARTENDNVISAKIAFNISCLLRAILGPVAARSAKRTHRKCCRIETVHKWPEYELCVEWPFRRLTLNDDGGKNGEKLSNSWILFGE